jgi:hypothetical protein
MNGDKKERASHVCLMEYAYVCARGQVCVFIIDAVCAVCVRVHECRARRSRTRIILHLVPHFELGLDIPGNLDRRLGSEGLSTWRACE